jgi:glycosyltransferase involved in cell wall biosynthesis
MRVLLIGAGMYPYEVGGAQTHAFHLAEALARRGHEVHSVGLSRRTEARTVPIELNQPDGVTARRIEVADAPDRVAAMARQWVEADIRQEVDAFRPDLVHVFKWGRFGSALLNAVAQAEVPVVQTALGFSYFCALGSLLRRFRHVCDGQASSGRCLACVLSGGRFGENRPLAWMGKALAASWRRHPTGTGSGRGQLALETMDRWEAFRRLQPLVVAPSEVVRRLFILNGYPQDRVVLLPYGVPDWFAQQRRPKSRAARLRLAYLGNVSAYKGVAVAIEAARRAANAGAHFEFRIFGTVAPEHDSYQAGVFRAVNKRAWPPHARVELCGRFRQEQLPEIHADTDVVVFPSLWPENATIVVLESLALGTPVLAGSIEGIREFIRNGVNGWYFDRGDAAALGSQILDLSCKLGVVRQAQSEAQPVLLFSAMVEKLEALYHQALEARTVSCRTCSFA